MREIKVKGKRILYSQKKIDKKLIFIVTDYDLVLYLDNDDVMPVGVMDDRYNEDKYCFIYEKNKKLFKSIVNYKKATL